MPHTSSQENSSSWKNGARAWLFGAALLALVLGVVVGRSSGSSSEARTLLPPRWQDSTQIVPARATTRMARVADLMPMPSLPEPPEETGPAVERELGTGRASYYGRGLAGNPTANGERFDPAKFTAAHPKLPFGSRVRVTNLRNDLSVVVRINDRGPYSGNRAIDLSRRAAEELKMVSRGLARVRIELLEKSEQ